MIIGYDQATRNLVIKTWQFNSLVQLIHWKEGTYLDVTQQGSLTDFLNAAKKSFTDPGFLSSD